MLLYLRTNNVGISYCFGVGGIKSTSLVCKEIIPLELGIKITFHEFYNQRQQIKMAGLTMSSNSK